MKKILFISYLFPPMGGGGVIRVTKFIKYLPKFGWQPTVLTVKKGFYNTYDPSLLKEIPNDISIRRINYFEPAFWFEARLWQSFLAYIVYPWLLVFDRQILWFLPALISSYRMIKKEKIEVIFTSSASTADHLVALMLKKIIKVKWVADFRDEWSNNPFRYFPTPLHRFLAKYFEKKVIDAADKITTVSEPITVFLQSRAEKKDKFQTIPNGYDKADFLSNKKPSGLFKIVYTGIFYSKDQIKIFNEAIKELNLSKLRLEIYGEKKFIPHKEAIGKILDASVLLFVLSSAKRPGVYTGKLFEYLAAKKPILALAPQNTVATRLIKKLKVGEVIAPDDKEGIKRTVLNYYRLWQENKLSVPVNDLSQFERETLTQKLSIELEKLVEPTQKRIKLCLIGNAQSIHIQKLCKYLVPKNYDLHLISFAPQKIPGVKVHVLSKCHLRYRPLCFLINANKTRKIVQRLKPDLIHGFDLVAPGIWTYLAGFHPYIVSSWGTDIIRIDDFIPIQRFLMKRSLKQADLVICQAQALRERAQELGVKIKNFEIVHFGIDMNIFKPSPKINRNKEKIIYSPRSLDPIYNPDILVKAFAILARKNDKIKLALLANYSDKKYLDWVRGIIREEKIEDKVFFWPKTTVRGIVSYYHQAEIVMSISSADGCSIPMLEAMACQKKIVVSNLPYIKEWNLKNNLWVAGIRNINETAKAIDLALRYSPQKTEKIGEFNRQLVKDRAEIQANFDKLDFLYRKILS